MRRAIVLILTLFLGACSSTGPLFVDAAPPSGGKALVYIYRNPAAAFAVRSASFSVDGSDVAGLLQNGYTYVYLTPGHHAFKQWWPYWPGDIGTVANDIDLPVEVEAGQTYYYRFTTGFESVASAPLMRFEWALTRVPADQGRAELLDKHLEPPKANGS